MSAGAFILWLLLVIPALTLVRVILGDPARFFSGKSDGEEP